MYRPLPDVLTIGPSKIDGLGLLALDDIEKGTVDRIKLSYHSIDGVLC